jgi:hypothetical protein
MVNVIVRLQFEERFRCLSLSLLYIKDQFKVYIPLGIISLDRSDVLFRTMCLQMGVCILIRKCASKWEYVYIQNMCLQVGVCILLRICASTWECVSYSE